MQDLAERAGEVGATQRRSREHVRDDLGVGLRVEDGALGFELKAQLHVVLDDTVVDQDQVVDLVWVCVLFGGRAVRRPAGVPDAHVAVDGGVIEARFEGGELAFGAVALEGAAIKDREACAVVASVFLAAEAVEEDATAVAVADITNDATHGAFRGDARGVPRGAEVCEGASCAWSCVRRSADEPARTVGGGGEAS